MGHRGFEGLRAASMKAAAEATAILTEQKRERRKAIRQVIEGSGGNYLKAVVYQDDGQGTQPKHVLLYLFAPGEAGETMAAQWLAEARFQHGVAMRASVYAACAGPLAALPVIGEPVRQSKANAIRVELDRAKADALVEREEAA